MNQPFVKNKLLLLLSQASYFLFFTGFIFSFRAITSISILLILLFVMVENRRDMLTFFRRRLKNPFVIACALLFLLQIISLLYTHDMQEGFNNIRLKSGLLFIPLAFADARRIGAEIRKRIFTYYCIILIAASLYCVFMAIRHYLVFRNTSFFFYHALVGPLSQNAVYFSLFIFIAIVFLLQKSRKRDFIFNPFADVLLILFFSVFLFLLSSKLIIAFYLIYLCYYFIILFKKKLIRRALILTIFTVVIGIGGSVLLIRNPVSNRFYEILSSDLKLVNQDQFNPGIYFNGLQFRLLQWKFVPEILNETETWLTGVSPGDAQNYLDNKYISKNMYTGNGMGQGRGLLGYNTHNQFLQALLQTGIIGLCLLLVLSFCLLRMAWYTNNGEARFIILLLIAWMFSESVFETQYGILLITFFPLFICPGEGRSLLLRKQAGSSHKKQILSVKLS